MHRQTKDKQRLRIKRSIRTRRHTRGSPVRPRLSVFKSNEHLYAQIIDDTIGQTLVGISTLAQSLKEANLNCKSRDAAVFLGKAIAKGAKEKQIDQVVFDRGPYPYHGLIAALADAARSEGLSF